MTTVTVILTPVATITVILVKIDKSVQAQGRMFHKKTLTNSAYWHTRKRTSLGSGSLASSQAELDPPYIRAGI